MGISSALRCSVADWQTCRLAVMPHFPSGPGERQAQQGTQSQLPTRRVRERAGARARARSKQRRRQGRRAKPRKGTHSGHGKEHPCLSQLCLLGRFLSPLVVCAHNLARCSRARALYILLSLPSLVSFPSLVSLQTAPVSSSALPACNIITIISPHL